MSTSNLNFDEYKDIWVFAEHADGKLADVALELLGEGKRLAKELHADTKVCAVLLGNNVDNLANELFAYGADEVYMSSNSLLENYTTDGYTKIVASAILEKKPEIVLFGATCNGRDLAPRVAARVKTGLTADCTRLDIDSNGYVDYLKTNAEADTGIQGLLCDDKNLKQTLPAFGGKLLTTIVCAKTRPQMCTVRPGVMQKLEKDLTKKGAPIVLDINITENDLRVKVLEVVKAVKETVSLSDAEIICAGGRGLDGKKGFDLLNELANTVGGVVGATRGLVDMGFADISQMIGQTGTTVKPKIYFACGISGAMQHVSGIQKSDCIIAINKDANAPIFGIADYAIVGDLHKVIPEIIKKWK